MSFRNLTKALGLSVLALGFLSLTPVSLKADSTDPLALRITSISGLSAISEMKGLYDTSYNTSLALQPRGLVFFGQDIRKGSVIFRTNLIHGYLEVDNRNVVVSSGIAMRMDVAFMNGLTPSSSSDFFMSIGQAQVKVDHYDVTGRGNPMVTKTYQVNGAFFKMPGRDPRFVFNLPADPDNRINRTSSIQYDLTIDTQLIQ